MSVHCLMLDRQQPLFIAEVKTKSPFGFESRYSWDTLFGLAVKHGDMVSIHTDERWGGSLEILQEARLGTTKPILAKGFHTTDRQIEECLLYGADYVLTWNYRSTHFLDRTFAEVSTLSQIRYYHPTQMVVWNARDPRTGNDNPIPFTSARYHRGNGLLCQASHIRTPDDVRDANAFIVGEHLPEFVGGQ